MKKPRSKNLCPYFQTAMDLLSRPWTGLILLALAERPLRYSELSERLDVLGDRMLSDRLKDLEEAGIVRRKVLTERPVGVQYELTELGLGFREVAEAVGKWGYRILGQAQGRKRAARARSA